MRSSRRFAIGVLVVDGALVAAPVAAFVVSALAGGASGQALAEVWRQVAHTPLLRNSLILATLTAALATCLGVPLGYLVSRTNIPLRQTLAALGALPLFLPPLFLATGWQSGLRAHGPMGAVLVMTVALFPLVALLAGLGFAHIDPVLEEDIRTVAGEFQVFRHVALPLARPLIATGFLLVFVLTLSEFGVPALMQVDVYPLAVFTAFSAFYDFRQAALLCLPFLVVSVALAAALYRATRDVDLASLGERWQARTISLGRGRYAAAAVGFLLLTSLVALPFAVLVLEAKDPSLWQTAWEPLLLSLGVSALGATVLVFLGLAVAWLCQRGYAIGGAAWLRAQIPLFALPSTVVGLGLVALWNRPLLAPVYGSAAMIVLGCVARFGPLIAAALAAFLAQVPRDCEEAIWLDGGGVGVTFTRYIVPVSQRALAVLWAGSFVLCMGELATTILIAPSGVQTLAVRLFTVEANAPQGQVASLALLLAAGCLTPLALLAAARAFRGLWPHRRERAEGSGLPRSGANPCAR